MMDQDSPTAWQMQPLTGGCMCHKSIAAVWIVASSTDPKRCYGKVATPTNLNQVAAPNLSTYDVKFLPSLL